MCEEEHSVVKQIDPYICILRSDRKCVCLCTFRDEWDSFRGFLR